METIDCGCVRDWTATKMDGNPPLVRETVRRMHGMIPMTRIVPITQQFVSEFDFVTPLE